MAAAAARKAAESECATVIRDDAERDAGRAALAALEAQGTWTRANVVASLTMPRGEEYLDNSLVRFLRARKGDVDKAATMMSEALLFRKRYDVDNILARPLSDDLLQHVHKGVYEGLLPGFDKLGRPMYVQRGGASNAALHGLLQAPAGQSDWSLGQLEDVWLHWHLQMMEYLSTVLFAEATRRKGSLVNKYVVVDDLHGFSLHGLRALYGIIPGFKKLAHVDQLLYPELLSVLLFLNSPAIFRAPWKIISSFVDAETNRKICVLGGAAQYGEAMQSLLGPESLPPFLGGTLAGSHVCDLEASRTEVFGAIEASIAAAGAAAGFDAAQRSQPMTAVLLAPSATHVASMQVTAGAVAEWQVVADAADVAYAAAFKRAGASETAAENVDTPTAEDLRVAGGMRMQFQFRAPADGVVSLTLTNRHNMPLRSKRVRFRMYSWTPT